MNRAELVAYLNAYLRIEEIKDYGPQGLQIEGRGEVERIVGAVDSHQPVVEAALAAGGDLLLVHHGIFWGAPRLLSGSYGKLVRTFIQNDLNLYAAHLALDAHPEVGNNAELARRLGLTVVDWWASVNGVKLGVIGKSDEDISFADLVARFARTVGEPKLVQANGPSTVGAVGILSGFGARDIEAAAALGCNTVVTGETSHANYYDAFNLGVNVLYGGHYTSETVGVQALGAHLAQRFGLDFTFVDLPTGL
jgi:dinuclear metal center YbgI/SA1388 family protein